MSEGGNLTIVLELVGGDNTTAVNVTVTPMPGMRRDISSEYSLRCMYKLQSVKSLSLLESTDYTLSPDPVTLDFTDGDRMQTITVSAETDSIVENTESFTLSLNSTDMMIVLDDPATVSIEDNTSQCLHNVCQSCIYSHIFLQWLILHLI